MAPTIKYNDWSIPDLISGAFADVESLREELESWLENLPDSLRDSEVGERLQTAIDSMSQYDEPNLPELPDEIAARQFKAIAPKNKRPSRAARMSEAVYLLNVAKEAIDTLNDEQQVERDKNADDYAEPEWLEELM